MLHYWFNLPSIQTRQKEKICDITGLIYLQYKLDRRRRYATTLVFILPTNMRKANLFADT